MKRYTFLLFAVLFALSLGAPSFAAKGGIPNSENGNGKGKNGSDPAPAPTLSSLAISGPSSVDESTSATFQATATWSDGTTSAANPTWSENSAYATINANGVLTTSEVTADQAVTVTASYTSDGVTKTASKSVTIMDTTPAAPTLSSLAISGPSSLDENTSATFQATATWSDGTTSAANPTWSENSAYAAINANGVLTASEVSADQTVTVNASYTSDGVTKTASKSVTIMDNTPAAPTLSSLAISGPSSLDENTSATFSATATWSDGSTSAAAPVWSENSAYATINANGVLTASEVTDDQTMTVTASYTSEGATKTASKSVSIADVTEASQTVTTVFGDVPDADYPKTVTDTFININTENNLTNTSLNTYTWPANTPANAILMKWDISALPANAQITDAKLHLYLSGTGGDSLYDLSVHKVINKNPDLTKADGYTHDGANSWTANSVAYNGVPLAQKDIAPAADVQSIDTASGYKTWNVTQLVKDWKSTPQSNYGLLLNSDTSASSDSNRTFASSEAADGSKRPKLVITYTLDPNYTPPPRTLSSLVVSGPSSLEENTSTTFSATATWSDGSTSMAAPTWSENSAYAAINSQGVLSASEVTSNRTVTVTASYSSGGVTKTASKSVSIIDTTPAAPTLSGLTINGPSSMDENASTTFSAKATWSDGSTTTVNPTWSENSAYAAINSNGVLTASAVSANQTVTVSASYISGGVTRSATKSVVISDVPATLPPQITLAWDRSTDSQVIGYRLYYKESSANDPSYKTLPFNSTGLPEGRSPIDVGLNETFTVNLPYDTTVFCFTVTAYNADGLESDNSNIVCTEN